MSIDYHAEYGIGYKVIAVEGLSDELLEEGLGEYLCELVSDGFSTFMVGCALSGEYEGVYLVYNNPFQDGTGLGWVKANLNHEVSRLGLEVEGEFGLVGGLYVC